jgi:hypothetical protein
MVSQAWWFTPVILATQEAEIRRIAVQDQLWAKKVQTTSISANEKLGAVVHSYHPSYLRSIN